MGASGSGKTTVGAKLAARLGRPFADADDFHPEANVRKMQRGTPLDDDDRAPWLASIRAWLAERSRAHESAVVTCSALKRRYRDVLRAAPGRVRFVHLTGSRELLQQRVGGRQGHFLPTSILPSQLATLEPLEPGEDGVTVEVDVPPDEVVERALRALGEGGCGERDRG